MIYYALIALVAYLWITGGSLVALFLRENELRRASNLNIALVILLWPFIVVFAIASAVRDDVLIFIKRGEK